MKRCALLIGVTYTGEDRLDGTLNDTAVLYEKLQTVLHYEPNEITALIENVPGFRKPTAANIMNAIIDMVLNCWYHGCTECFVHFSGHGDQEATSDRNEADGLNECIVSCDGQKITDDMLNHYFGYFPAWCRVLCVFDACHSGTMLDLCKRIHPQDWRHEDMNPQSHCKGKNIITISGCRDAEVSWESVHANGSWGGALTTALVQVMDENDLCLLTWKQLIEKLHVSLGNSQTPVMCASRDIHVDTRMCRNGTHGIMINI